jgi:hypothetical protein
MRPSRLVSLSVLTASTIMMSAAVPTGPALARSPFPGVFAPIFGAVGHLLPHRHGHHRRSHHVASHAASARPAGEHRDSQPANVNTATAAPNTGGQIAAGSQPFWPQLADDLFDYVFWPSGNDDRFWAYGYNEIVEGALHPASRESLRASAPARGRTETQTTGSVADAPSGCASQQGSETADSLIKRIESTVQPTDAQRAALDNLHTAAQHAFDYLDKACPKTRPQTPTTRLDAMEDRIWAARQALLVMRAPVDKLYGSLTDAQKARLNAPSGPSGQSTTRPAGCNESHIDLARMLTGGRGRPDPKQRRALEALQKTSTGLSRLLAASCPSTLPSTPVDRLDTADRRLNSMLYAVVTLRAPLDALSSAPAAQQQPKVSGLRR